MKKVYIWDKLKVHAVIGAAMAFIAVLLGIIYDLSGVMG